MTPWRQVVKRDDATEAKIFFEGRMDAQNMLIDDGADDGRKSTTVRLKPELRRRVKDAVNQRDLPSINVAVEEALLMWLQAIDEGQRPLLLTATDSERRMLEVILLYVRDKKADGMLIRLLHEFAKR